MIKYFFFSKEEVRFKQIAVNYAGINWKWGMKINASHQRKPLPFMTILSSYQEIIFLSNGSHRRLILENGDSKKVPFSYTRLFGGAKTRPQCVKGGRLDTRMQVLHVLRGRIHQWTPSGLPALRVHWKILPLRPCRIYTFLYFCWELQWAAVIYDFWIKPRILPLSCQSCCFRQRNHEWLDLDHA